MVIKINYTSSDVYVSTSVSPVYVVVNYSGTTTGAAIWGQITGTLSDQTDLQTALDDKVPYTGATANVDLGGFSIKPSMVQITGINSGGTGGVLNLKKGNTRVIGGDDAANNISLWAETGAFGFNDWTAGNTRDAKFSLLSITNNATRTYTLPNLDGTLALLSDITPGLTSVGLSMPSAFAVSNSPLTSNGTIAVTGAGTASQYVRGDGQLANFPTNGGGGSSVNYYLNGSVSQGTFGGDTYYEMSKTPVLGAGTDFTRTNAQGNGYIASFITDAGDPSLLSIPGGNWNLEFYFNASSSGSTPQFYGEIYKVDASNNFTLVASASANPETISSGTIVDQYFTSIPVPQTSLLSTDRLAVRIYVIPSGRTITLHTENSNLCEVLTTFSTGLNALNGLTSQVQYFATGTSGTDFAISSVTDTHTFNLPTASATNRGALSSADWSTFSAKVGGSGVSGQVTYWNGTSSQTGSNNLFWDAANARLGIGTNAPAYKLHVIGDSFVSNDLYVNRFIIMNTADRIKWITRGSLYAQNNGDFAFRTETDGNVARFSNTTSFISSGNFILGGTTDGGQRLQVQGTALITGNTEISAGNLSIFTTNTPRRLNLQVANGSKAAAIGIEAGGVIHSVIGVDTSGTDFLQVASKTGISFYSGSTIGNIVTDPTNERMRLTTAGRLLLGTTTESTFLLDVNGTARVSGNLTVDTNTLFVDATNDRVGIGTTSPATKLEIVGASGLQVRNGAADGFSFQQANTNTWAWTGLTAVSNYIIQNANVGIGTTSPSQKLHLLDGIARFDNVGTQLILGTSGVAGSYEFAVSTGNVFSISLSGVGERMRLTSGGNLLVGTTTDAGFKLDVNGTARVGGSSASAQLYLKGGVGNGQYLYFDDGGSNLWTIVGASIFAIDSSSTRIFRANANAQVTINGSSVNATAQLQVDSTTRGFLPPRMTNAQRTAISSPAVGLIVYCTDATEGLYQYINNAWVNLTGVVTNRQTTSYTLALGDSNDLVEMNVATANNLTVPLNSSVAFPIGTKIDIAQYGAGQTTVVATSGVTVRSAGGALKLAVQYSGGSLVKIATDEWYLFGDITV